MIERYALGVSYEGSQYFGWQHQPKALTVQCCVEKALFEMTGESVNAICAGRTDKGVHALNQVVHFDTRKSRDEYTWIMGLNAHLPHSIRVHWIQKVAQDFHARFSACSRHYRYLILNDRVGSPHLNALMTWYPFPLDHERMQTGACFLLGDHDFSAFRGKHCQSLSPIRRVTHLEISRQGKIIQIDIKANAFLHHMVRNIVGTLFAVGRRKVPPEWIAEVLASRQRREAGVTAPPQGLYFMKVDYPEPYAHLGMEALLAPADLSFNTQ